MTHIPLHAKVQCADGVCGESITVIVNPTTQSVTHFVVKDKSLPDPDERLVPVDQVEEVTPQLIRLRCTKTELAEMEPFTETQFIKTEEPSLAYSQYDSYMFPYVMNVEMVELPVEVERVPPGELAIHRGTLVEATDGFLGEVGELVVDPQSRHITHFVLREGHLWGKKEITLPLSTIERNYSTGEAQIQLMAKVYDSPEGASKALEFVEDLHRRKTIKIHNAAVLVKDQDGTTHVKDTRDIGSKKGRVLGAVTGGLIGLLGGPAGVVVGALAGAGAGGLAAGKLDFGFSDKFLENLKQYLQPGTSALILLVERDWVGQITEILAKDAGVLLQQTITDAVVERLLDDVEETE
jgi:uncharacterized membrane protein